MADGLRARPPTRDQIAQTILVASHGQDIGRWLSSLETSAHALADALLAEFSIVARGDTPPAPADDLAKFVDYEGIGTAIGESVFLSSQGFDDWPTLEQCKAAGVRATREIASELTDALRWREHICAVPPGDGRVVVMHRDRYEALIAKAGESLDGARGVTPDPQTADAAFDAWSLSRQPNMSPLRVGGTYEAFRAGWNARAAVGDSPRVDGGV